MSPNSLKTKDRVHFYSSQFRGPLFRPFSSTASHGGGFIAPPSQSMEATSWIGDHSSVLERSRLAH